MARRVVRSSSGCLALLAFVVGSLSCGPPGSSDDEFGRLALAHSGWTVRVRDGSGSLQCTQVAPVGIAYSGAWSCSDVADGIWASAFVAEERLVIHGVLPRDTSRVMIDHAFGDGGRDSGPTGDGVFLAVADLDGGTPDVVHITALDKEGGEIATKEVRVVDSDGRPR